MVSEFGKVLIYLITAIVIMLTLFGISRWIAPYNPTSEKNSTYECGEPTVGNAWIPISAKYYVIALIFLLFEIEIVFIFPWTVIFDDASLVQQNTNWGWMMLSRMFIFISILLLGLWYVWKNNDLNWLVSTKKHSEKYTIPTSAYGAINEAIYTPIAPVLEEKPLIANPEETVISTKPKPAFKPVFRKPNIE